MTDFILNPAVGVTLNEMQIFECVKNLKKKQTQMIIGQECVTFVISSEANCFKSVVFPALSKPNSNIRTSCSGDARNFLNKANNP